MTSNHLDFFLENLDRSQADQAQAQIEGIADMAALFFLRLRTLGIPLSAATTLTQQWMMITFQGDSNATDSTD